MIARISKPGLICMDSVSLLNIVGVYINAPVAGTVRTERVRRVVQLQRASTRSRWMVANNQFKVNVRSLSKP